MKLLTKTTLYFFLAMVLLLAATGFYLFQQFSRQINQQSDQELMMEEAQWIDYLQSGVANGTTFILRTKELAIYPVTAPVNDFPLIEDVSGRSSKTGRAIAYRQLSQVIDIIGVPYQIVIKKSQEQKAALVAGFTRVMLLVFAGLFIVSLIFNWVISNRLWKPFQKSLQKIRTAELQKMQAMHFEQTNTKEFNELNTSLNEMTAKIYSDFVNMKEFTENAAHEMQTPIAVVQTKLELLLQATNLEDAQLQSVAEASNALNRLGKLNQGLLLLAKIENNQYGATENIDLAGITEKYLQLFSELIKDKQLTVSTSFAEPFAVTVHSLLADSLIANLLGNAIKYNQYGGFIHIATTVNSFRIGNSSEQPAIPTDKLFKRFSIPAESASVSNGLGLAIVKKIIDTNGLRITYEAKEGAHYFTINR